MRYENVYPTGYDYYYDYNIAFCGNKMKSPKYEVMYGGFGMSSNF